MAKEEEMRLGYGLADFRQKSYLGRTWLGRSVSRPLREINLPMLRSSHVGMIVLAGITPYYSVISAVMISCWGGPIRDQAC